MRIDASADRKKWNSCVESRLEREERNESSVYLGLIKNEPIFMRDP